MGLFPFDNQDNKLIFYSHAESDILFDPIWLIFQRNDDGFNQLIEPDMFQENQAPIVSLSGERINNEMIYSISLIGLSDHGLVDQTEGDNSVLGVEIVPTNIFSTDFINSSSTSVDSVISIQTYGSFIDSKNRVTKSNFLDGNKESDIDNAIISHNFAEYGSNIAITLSPGSSFNQSFPLIYYPPVLSVIRDIENGNLNTGDTLESRITFTNLSPELEGIAIDRITFTDNWWSDHFELLEGGGNETIENLEPGESVTVSKLLSVTSDDSIEIISNYDDIVFDYSFTIDDVEISSQTRSNEFSIILNDIGPSLLAVSNHNKSYIPMHDVVTANLELRNIGSRSAYSVRISLNDTLVKELDSIPPDLDKIITISTNISNSDLLLNSQNYVWDVIWTERDEERCVYSNPFTITDEYNIQNSNVFIEVPDLTIEKSSPIPLDGIWKEVLEIEIKITNNGNMNLTNIDILDTLPLNVDLHTSSDFVTSPLVSSSGKYITTFLPVLNSKNTTTLRYNLTYDQSENVILPPAKISLNYNNDDFTFLSKSSVLPIAVHISKTIDVDQALTGYNFTMNIEFENSGDLMLHDVGVKGNDDEYIVIEGADWDERSTLSPGGIMTNEYVISSTDEGVVRNLLQARGEFTLAGKTVRIFTEQIPISIIKSPVITIDIPEDIFDNEEVDMVITISNPSNFTLNSIVISPDILNNIVIVDNEEIFSTIQSLDKGDSIKLTSKVIGISPGKELQFKPIVSHLHLGQTISVPIDELSIFVSEELRNRYLPSLSIALALMFVLLYLSNKLIIRKD